jgi:hypothetical protein
MKSKFFSLLHTEQQECLSGVHIRLIDRRGKSLYIQEITVPCYVGFEVLIAVVTNVAIFWNIEQYTSYAVCELVFRKNIAPSHLHLLFSFLADFLP